MLPSCFLATEQTLFLLTCFSLSTQVSPFPTSRLQLLCGFLRFFAYPPPTSILFSFPSLSPSSSPSPSPLLLSFPSPFPPPFPSCVRPRISDLVPIPVPVPVPTLSPLSSPFPLAFLCSPLPPFLFPPSPRSRSRSLLRSFVLL